MKLEIFHDYLYDLLADYRKNEILEKLGGIASLANRTKQNTEFTTNLKSAIREVVESLDSFRSNEHLFSVTHQKKGSYDDLRGLNLASQIRTSLEGPIFSPDLAISVSQALRIRLAEFIKRSDITLDVFKNYEFFPFFNTTKDVEFSFIFNKDVSNLNLAKFNKLSGEIQTGLKLLERGLDLSNEKHELLSISTSNPTLTVSVGLSLALTLLQIWNVGLDTALKQKELDIKTIELQKLEIDADTISKISEAFEKKRAAAREEFSEKILEDNPIEDNESRTSFKMGVSHMLNLIEENIGVYTRQFKDDKDSREIEKDAVKKIGEIEKLAEHVHAKQLDRNFLFTFSSPSLLIETPAVQNLSNEGEESES